MPASNSSWGIEVGSYAVKALRLERQGDNVTVTDFAYIPHKKVLSTPDLDRDEMTRLSLGQFIAQQRGTDSAPTVVSVPGNAAFARFAKLPPVEPKKVPDIVKFEAVQQIPFPIEEVEWDYQTFTSEGSPDVEVGIFAMTKPAVQSKIALYGDLGMTPDGITLSPISVFNAMMYDLGLDENSPGVIILDIGTESTDLIIAEQGRCWVRTFPIGGHNFTDALISSFKLTYSKAEKLKGEAQTSKYRRQILSAMRPVFADLAQDVQRSIGYYQSMHGDADLQKLIGVGSTFKLPGLRKFLSQQLQMEVLRVDEYERLNFSGPSDSKFADHAVNFATAYGLALQGLDDSDIAVNLVPVQVVRERMWHSKIKWFGAAAAVAVAASMLNFVRPMLDGNYVAQPAQFQSVNDVIREAEGYKSDFEDITTNTTIDEKASNVLKMLAYRDIWPQVMDDFSAMMASGNPQAELFGHDLDAIQAIPFGDRRSIDLESMESIYKSPSSADSGDDEDDEEDSGMSSAAGNGMPRVAFRIRVSTTNQGSIGFVERNVIGWLRSNADRPGNEVPYRIITAGDAAPSIDGFKSISIGEEDDDAAMPRNRRSGRGGEGGSTYAKGGGYEGGGEGMMMGGPTMGGERGAMSGGSIDAMAPLPKSGDIAPADTMRHVMTILFEIELLTAEEIQAANDDEEVQK